jgi:hypothetical protein
MTSARRPRHHVSTLATRFVPTRPAYTLAPEQPLSGPSTLLRPCSTPICRYGNINPFPIDYAVRLRLRGRLTLPGLSLDRKPWASGDKGFHLVYRYSCQHSHFLPLHHPSPGDFTATGTLPYHSRRVRSFGDALSPVIFTAQDNLTSELLRFL